MFSEFVKKEWGYERILHNKDFCVKVMGLDQGAQCSVHYHIIKKEMFIVTNGVIRVELWDKLVQESAVPDRNDDIFVTPPNLDKPDKILILDAAYSGGAFVYVGNFVPHRFIGLGKLNEFIEASNHDSPDDSYRFTSSRKPDNR